MRPRQKHRRGATFRPHRRANHNPRPLERGGTRRQAPGASLGGACSRIVSRIIRTIASTVAINATNSYLIIGSNYHVAVTTTIGVTLRR